MAPVAETKWWGWGRYGKSFHLPADSAFWDQLSRLLGPLGTNPAIDSLNKFFLVPSRLSEQDLKLLQDIVGEEHVSTHSHVRVIHSLGKSYPDLIRVRQGSIPHPTDAVIYPGTEAEIEAILKLVPLRRGEWTIIPFGGGTSVVGGVEPSAGEGTVITLNLQRLDKILEIDTQSALAAVECGILGPELEKQLNSAGFTLGHFPQSFEFSTLGGWIAARSAGQFSTKYGKIEDMVCSLRVVTPSGTVETPHVPAAAAGSNLLQMLVGSEGSYGIFTRATVKLHPLPPVQKFQTFLFHSFEAGVTAIRQLLQRGLRPTLLRLSDENETAMSIVLAGQHRGLKNSFGKWWVERKGFSFSHSALLLLGFDAPAGKSVQTLLRAELQVVKEIMLANGGLFIGSGAGDSWYKNRFELPYLRDLLLDRAIMTDTLETSTTWQNLLQLYGEVKKTLKQTIELQDEKPLVLTHLSHAYSEGASLYFTFMARQKPGKELEQWQQVKDAATECIIQNHGALSHHHGVGTMHKPWMEQYHGQLGAGMMSNLKALLDPKAIMNPGKLITGTRTFPAAPKTAGAFSHKTRSINIARFADEEFDLAIIGGGITGAGIARDAAMRGLKVALIDQSDFAGGTSSKSSKMIHGGLRYLKHLDIKLVKESLHERQTLLHIAPHLVYPAPHLIPLYKGRLEKIEIQIGMIGYDMLASSESIAPYQKLSSEDVFSQEPMLKKSGLHGGFVYYDCLVNDARLTLATLKSAAEFGATIANYVKCVGLETKNDSISGVLFKDVSGDSAGMLRAKVIVNATGPWADLVRAFANDNKKMLRPTKGIHLVVPSEKLKVQNIIVLTTYDERMIFVVPLAAFTYIGTTDTDYTGPLDDVHTNADDVSYLLRNTNRAFENLHLTESDVVSTWAGLRPLVDETGSPSSVSRDYEIAVNDKGLVTVAGGKLTTYRAMAEAVLDEIIERLGKNNKWQLSPCRTAEIPLFGGNISSFEQYLRHELKETGGRWGISEQVLERLLHLYGTEHIKILELSRQYPGMMQTVSPDAASSTIMQAEVVYSVQNEMAMSIGDFMERRTELKLFDFNSGVKIAESVTHLMGDLLQWNSAERRRQLEDYRNSVRRMTAFRQETEDGDRRTGESNSSKLNW